MEGDGDAQQKPLAHDYRRRSNWSALVNESLKAKNIGGFIDHCSYEEIGLDIAAIIYNQDILRLYFLRLVIK